MSSHNSSTQDQRELQPSTSKALMEESHFKQPRVPSKTSARKALTEEQKERKRQQSKERYQARREAMSQEEHQSQLETRREARKNKSMSQPSTTIELEKVRKAKHEQLRYQDKREDILYKKKTKRDSMSEDELEELLVKQREEYAKRPKTVSDMKLADRREVYHSLNDEVRLSILETRRENYQNLPQDIHQAILETRREEYQNLPQDIHQAILETRREEYQNLPQDIHQAILETRREEYQNIPQDIHQAILETRREEYQNLPQDVHQAILETRREGYINLPKNVRENMLETRRGVYHSLPENRRQEHLEARREEYASLPPELHQAKLATRRERYRSISTEDRELSLEFRRLQYAEQTREERQTQLEQRARERYEQQEREEMASVEETASYLADVDQMIADGDPIDQVNRRFDAYVSSQRRALRNPNLGAAILDFEGKLRDQIVEEHCLGPMNLICKHCGAAHFAQEAKGSNRDEFEDCCKFGKVKFNLPECPDFLYRLYTNNLTREEGGPSMHRHFLRNIRAYNNALAMASITYKPAHPQGLPGRGPMPFKVQGQIYHHMHNLVAGGPQVVDGVIQATYNQTWLLDPEQQVDARATESLNSELLAKLQECLRAANPAFYDRYYSMYELEQDRIIALDQNQVKVVITQNAGDRRSCPPTLSDVAAIFVDEDNDLERGVYCYLKNRSDGDPGDPGRVFIRGSKAVVDPLTYPLLFPTGFLGWEPQKYFQVDPESGDRLDNQVTAIQFYRYMTAVRPGKFNPIHYAKRLFQQYSVDAYIKSESHNLNYIRRCQLEGSRDSWQNVQDYVDQLDRDQVRRGPEENGEYRQPIDLAIGYVDDVAQGRVDQEVPANPEQVGRRVRLLSSFKHGYRAHTRNYYDATAIVSRYGQPDPFLTITCNPNWSDIQENLYQGQQALDRPDIVDRVFTLKVEAVIDDLSKKEVLGRHEAYMGVIEFQKRGLPHAHILAILKEGYKFRTPDVVDRVISAEIPPEDEPCRDLVATHMFHRKCGQARPNSMCMKDGQCSKNYPKPFAVHTELRGKYPVYRRSENGRSLSVHEDVFTNQDVVPFNPYFLIRYRTHINVESCTTSSACKYLYKYVYKGPDRSRVALVPVNGVVDETTHFQDHRFVCPYSALWNIQSNAMTYFSHTVVHLDVHLPNQQVVTFMPLQHRRAAERGPPPTTLTQWFATNTLSKSGQLQSIDRRRRDPEISVQSHHLHYWEFPREFRWVGREWKYSRSNKRLARMWTVSPMERERFYLRVLLLNRAGATSFEDLRTVQVTREDGSVELVVCATFEDACIQLGFIDYDQEYDICLTDAKRIEMPHKMRSIFGMIISMRSILRPVANRLWDKFKGDFCEDYLHRFGDRISVQDAEYLAYRCIEEQCAALEVNLEDFVDRPPHEQEVDLHMLHDEQVNLRQREHAVSLGEGLYRSLNETQRRIADAIMAACRARRDAAPADLPVTRCFFVDGPAGSGKTFVYNCLYNQLVGEGFRVLCVAWSGIAAGLLPEGMTASTAFKLPVPLGDHPFSNVRLQTEYARYLRSFDVIIWDEASMIPKKALVAVHHLFNDLTVPEVDSQLRGGLLFGGKVMLLGGDFRQVLPVVRRGTYTEIISETIKTWPEWRQFERFYLETNMRCSHQQYRDLIMQIGDGVLCPMVDVTQMAREFGWVVDSVEQLVNNVYSEFDELDRKAILAARNVDVRNLNTLVLERYREHLTERNRAQGRPAPLDILSVSADSIELDGTVNAEVFPIDFLNQYNSAGFSLHKLRLIEGGIYMLIRNIDLTKGLSNGQRVRLEGVYPVGRGRAPTMVRVRIVSGTHSPDEDHFIPKLALRTNKENQDLPFILKRKQFPIVPGFAMTIHKAQGQSFTRMSLYLERPVFAHGQLYVAMSRIRDPQHLRIFLERLGTRERTALVNVVWRAVLDQPDN